MRVGVSLTSRHAVEDVRAGARMMIERAAAARDAGLDSLFVGDHHLTPVPYYQNVPMLGRLLAEWGDAPAGALFLIPMWNPVLIAEQVGTLASIATGPFIVQCAIGRGPEEFAGIGANIKHRPSLFEEGLSIVRRLLAGETVSSDGRYHIEGASISPLPPEPVDIWIGGSVEPSIDRASRLGEAWLAGPELTMEQARHLARFHRERSEAHGRPPAAYPIRRDVYVGESDEEAEPTAGPVAGRYRGFDPDALIYGSIDTVAGRFRELAELGYTDVIMRSIVQAQPKTLASLTRLGEVRAAVADAWPTD
ncbi:MAG: LLM class flavin-dependent oxidoreductase [Dehalococcoidia bacterium]|nr:LLM class flavin-dependent oxidoreductase [Dehalococcoidia bacterium]